MGDSIDRLYQAVMAAKDTGRGTSRTARLLHSGRAKVAKKLAEEAAEVVIEAMADHHDNLVRESADLVYNLAVLWVATGVRPAEVWKEMERRERLYGIAEKLAKRELAKTRRKGARLRDGTETARKRG